MGEDSVEMRVGERRREGRGEEKGRERGGEKGNNCWPLAVFRAY